MGVTPELGDAGGEGRMRDDPVSSPAFVGRERELALVTAALDNPPALVLVEGEAGMGKSRLLRECLGRAPYRDQRVMVAACPPLREPFPLGPVVDGLRRVRERVGDVELSPLAGALRPLFPEWSADLPPPLEPLEDAGAMRHRLFRALAELVDRLGVDVLVVEDAHWADAATLEWLLTVTATGSERLSVVATFRPGDVPADSLLLRLTSRRPPGMALVRVTLRPLDAAQTGRLVASMFDTEVSERFARFLHERTDGVPLAVEESVLLLRDRHDVVRMGGEWARRTVEELEVPPTLRDVVQERVERLDPPARVVLEAAAVLSEPADEALLAEVAGLDEAEGRHGLGAALASGLLRETGPGRFAFRHTLHARAVEETVPAPRRRQMDRRAAGVLQRWEHPPVVRLSRHCRGAGDVAGWTCYGEAAARLALESGDHYMAVTILHELLTGARHPVADRARLARLLGEAAVHRPAPLAGLETVVRDTLQGVLSGEELPRAERGEIRLLLGCLLYQLADFDAGHAEVAAAVHELEGRPASAARAALALAWPESHRSWPVSRHLECLEQATALLPRIESPAARRALLVERAAVLLMLGEEDGWRAVAELPESASTPVERQQLVRCLLNVADNAMSWGRFPEAGRALDRSQELLRTDDVDVRGRAWAAYYASFLDWYTGAWDGLGERLAEAAAETGHVLMTLSARVVRACTDLLLLGQREAAEQQLRGVLAETDRLGLFDHTTSSLAAAALSRILISAGAAGEAVDVTEPVMEMVATKGAWLWASDIAPAYLDALVATGRVDRAEGMVERFAAWVRGRDVPGPRAVLLTCQAIVDAAGGDHRTAAVGFAEAAAAWAALPRPYDELLAAERQGRCLLAAGERERGVAVLEATQQRLRSMGARWDADRVAQLLRGQGVEVAHAWRGGRRGYGGELSPRELQVVELVTRGMTNRQIAESLFLSPRTVDRHLGAAMRKLGVSSRTALAVAATDTGLLPAPPT